MFASIPNFADFWTQADVQRKIECLRLLNEIVCAFDKVMAAHEMWPIGVHSCWTNQSSAALKK
jgi:hypothetical protein